MTPTLFEYISTVLDVLRLIIYILFPLAFLFFAINVFRYFIAGSGNDKARESARSYAIWGLLGLVILFAIWGILGVLFGILNVGSGRPIAPDYLCDKDPAACALMQQ